MRVVSYKETLAFLVLCSVIALVLSRLSGMWFVWALLIAVFAVLFNGAVATIEDDLPGGFNNPDGSDTPAYVHRLGRIVRWIASMVLGLVALGLFAAASRSALTAGPALALGCAIGALAVGVATGSRTLQWVALGFIAAGVLFTAAVGGLARG